MDILKDFNSNLYVKICSFLNVELTGLNSLIMDIRKEKEFAKVLDLTSIYQKIFSNPVFNNSVEIRIERVLNPHYAISGTTPIKSGNSSYFISIKIISIPLLKIDIFYEKQLTSLIRLFKNLFSVIDKPSYNIDEEDLLKYEALIHDINLKMNLFLSSSEHKDLIERREKLSSNNIRNLPHNGFYHMTHFNNLESVLKHGLLSHKEVYLKKVLQVDISNPTIQNDRNRNESIYDRNIQDYVPLYINPQNPMMDSERVKNCKSNIVLIEVIPHILVQEEKTLFSDGNAAQLETNFFQKHNEMEMINWRLLQEGKWIKGTESHRVMCSEVLIPDRIEVYYLNKIILQDDVLLGKVMGLFPNHKGISIEINSTFFSMENLN